MSRARVVSALLGLVALGAAPAVAQVPRGDSAAVAALINSVTYGVPTSPAFALLPQQASEVTHITTPADFQSNAASWLDGTRLKSGIAFDWRPLGSLVGSLEQYRRSRPRQVMWRTVLSAGTAPAAEKSPDVLLALGVRLPIIDEGDLRADTGYVRRLRGVLGAVLDSCGVVRPDEPADEADARCKLQRTQADSVVKAVQDSVITSRWNALRFDVGFAASARAAHGFVRTDSLAGDRAGVWLGLSHSLSRRLPAQVTYVVKASWARTDSAAQERARFVAGSRLRAFPFGRIGRTAAVSVEAAGVWTDFEAADKDDAWTHVAGVVEVPLPSFGGFFKNQWVAVGYGGDSGRRDGAGTQMSLRYAVYSNRLLK